MRLTIILFSLWLGVSAFGAITERYVSSSGSATYADSTNSATPCSLTTAFTSGVAGDRFNVKDDGTYSSTSATAITIAGTVTQPIIFRGYTTTIGDGFQGYNSDGSLNTANFPTLSFTGSGRLNSSGSFVIWENLIVTSAASAAAMTVGQEAIVFQCAVTNSSSNASAGGLALTSTGAAAIDSDAALSAASGGSYALAVQAGAAVADSCRVSTVSSTADGIVANNNYTAINNRVNTGGGVGLRESTTTSRGYVKGNTIYECGNGIQRTASATVLSKYVGNMITDGSGYAIEFNSVGGFNAFNRTRDNASGQFNTGGDWATASSEFNVTTDTGGAATDYVNAPSDLTPIRLSPATGAGLPQRTSIGALQRDQTTAAGGQKSFVVP